jgi:type I restriction enzyme S subunit
MIPAKWERLPLDHVAYVQTGLAKGKKDIKKPISVPYLRVANVQDGYLDISVIKSIEVEESSLDRYLLRPGDVLLTEGGDFDKLGRGAIWEGSINPCVHQNHIFVVRPKDELLIPQFLSLLTGSAHGKTYFLKCSKQSTNLASINSTQLKKFPVLLPPLVEQKKIVETVNAWNYAIEKTEQLIAAKEKLLHALHQKCFQPGTSMNRSWKLEKLSNLLKPRNKKDLPSKDLPLYSLTIENGVTAKTDRYNRDFLVKDVGSKTYKVVHFGDIVFNPANLRWGAIARSEIKDKVVISPIYEVLEIKDDLVDPDYLTHAITCLRQIGIFATKTEGTLIERMAVKLDAFLFLEILIPTTRDEQTKIAALLSAAKKEISLLKKQINAYRKQKRGLMQKLLTGEWLVKVNESEVTQ